MFECLNSNCELETVATQNAKDRDHARSIFVLYMQGIGGIRRPVGGVGYQTIEFRAPFEKLPGKKRKVRFVFQV